MSWWDNNKESIFKGAKTAGKYTYSGAKTVTKAGYKTYQNHSGNTHGTSSSSSSSKDTNTPAFDESQVRPIESLPDVSRFPPPPLKPGQMQYTHDKGVISSNSGTPTPVPSATTSTTTSTASYFPVQGTVSNPQYAVQQVSPPIPSRGAVPQPPVQSQPQYQQQAQPQPPVQVQPQPPVQAQPQYQQQPINQTQPQTQPVQQPISGESQQSQETLESLQQRMENRIQTEIQTQVKAQAKSQFEQFKNQFRDPNSQSQAQPEQQQIGNEAQANVVIQPILPLQHANSSTSDIANRPPAPIPPRNYNLPPTQPPAQAQAQVQPTAQIVDQQLETLRNTVVSPDLGNLPVPPKKAESPALDNVSVIPTQPQPTIASVASVTTTHTSLVHQKEEKEKNPEPALIASGKFNYSIDVKFAPPPKPHDRELHIRPSPKFRESPLPVKRLNAPPPEPPSIGSATATTATATNDITFVREEQSGVPSPPSSGIVGAFPPQLPQAAATLPPPPKPFRSSDPTTPHQQKLHQPPAPSIPSRGPVPPVPFRDTSLSPSFSSAGLVNVPPPAYKAVESPKLEVASPTDVAIAGKPKFDLNAFAPPPKPFRKPMEELNGGPHKNAGPPSMPPVRGNSNTTTTANEISEIKVEIPVKPQLDLNKFAPPPKPFRKPTEDTISSTTNPEVKEDRTKPEEEEFVKKAPPPIKPKPANISIPETITHSKKLPPPIKPKPTNISITVDSAHVKKTPPPIKPKPASFVSSNSKMSDTKKEKDNGEKPHVIVSKPLGPGGFDLSELQNSKVLKKSAAAAPPPPLKPKPSIPLKKSAKKQEDEHEHEHDSDEEEEENPFKRYLKVAVPKEDNHIK